ncbi:2-C-methyl-D-erythritol 2,4-cyclodiphosphate synthase [Fontimonas thermophila]|uniref:2-C-methyl-D-erythritol 2,4-cyclodiphosphate synthase n=1 Tax=Fontimonas thermophila TaxID=1076937 RepID=A0A1I2HLZ5_9GAMM|nr:2-C-methyl-D-erythritol 2,4-cyclodiphosphate synthase [Fontimonas thermophila]SFF30290.1 2-C-methyl-D-erythritol 2,4-cyclodiphosphate synthase [Fontimonas thermophila]
MSHRPPFRIGHGFDAHRLEAGDGVVLGGVRIPCPYRIVAHSDGDVLIHALCDALLGAIGGGDIGRLFPDTDPQYRGIDSRRLLAKVMRYVRAEAYAVVNADLSLIAQTPRVAGYVPAMRQVLAAELGVASDCVNVKATTNEGMDAIGRREGLAAHAVVLLQRID